MNLNKINLDKRKKQIETFNPDENGLLHESIFGLPFTEDTAELIIIPVPWEATVSYRSGTKDGYKCIKDASLQLDLSDDFIFPMWEKGIFMTEADPFFSKSDFYRKNAVKIIEQHSGVNTMAILKLVNDGCERMVNTLCDQSLKYLGSGRKVGLVGGDHSISLGGLRAMAELHSDFGILQIDAHADLRKAYEGFEFSHASIMYNALKLDNISKIICVGLRDYCREELKVKEESKGKIDFFSDYDIRDSLFKGSNWRSLCEKIIDTLPDKVYISFDIDGLDPALCPNTGTPVPGGLSFNEAAYLLKTLSDSGKKVIGFDLCEVAPGNDDWDGNVGARILYMLSNLLLKS
jgi:agmatinase